MIPDSPILPPDRVQAIEEDRVEDRAVETPNIDPTPADMKPKQKAVRFSTSDVYIKAPEPVVPRADPLVLPPGPDEPKQFYWDMRGDPKLQPSYPPKALAEENMNRPFSLPSSRSVEIRLVFPPAGIDASFEITSSREGSPVTVGDVLVGIYEALDQTPIDIDKITAWRLKEDVIRNFSERRTSTLEKDPYADVKPSIIDKLGDSRWFNGLQYDDERDAWQLLTNDVLPTRAFKERN